MLRFLFGESPHTPQGELADAVKSMTAAAAYFRREAERGRDMNHKQRTYEIWTLGLISSLDELEQSHYAAQRFGSRIRSDTYAGLTDEERLDYRRYVYFDKNMFIRLFALLDKLGTLLNDRLALETERVKPYFSYFTVLRRMRERRLHGQLAAALNEVNDKYEDSMTRLRKRRNVEVHNMNSELQDDLAQSRLHYGTEMKLENLQQQIDDSAAGLAMAAETLRIAFDYLNSARR
ncbi:Cthe_2314 family HEPN domain-containing protein [Paenibacillus beijingensis]|uniref:Cthe-2314-like HEPN domain-containing protein n=1 Tax=Paenibacillus beijingensis TaxID=1126833 RepID=A0A0D5NK80_9BACL|nr:Cthe_2314 family HEPN domain-containing protein [Paenibacillus beijingensis]AJY75754.1 hypothetical protein VN24_15825 [Paenibacillus beijingensis]